MKTLDDYKQIAISKILPVGVKPEDYYCIHPSFPLRISIMIVKEINHLMKMDKMKGVYSNAESNLYGTKSIPANNGAAERTQRF